jgi:folate-binding protein YgfZ
MKVMDPGLFCADRSERGKLRFTGPQRTWFLHQVLTQAFEDIAPGEARDAAMITPHGRMIGYLEVVATDDALLAHFEPELRPGLAEAIGRYVFATQVEISDVSDDMGLVLVGGELPESAQPAGTTSHPTRALGVPATYLWVERVGLAGVLAKLEGAGARRAEESELEAVRISQGVPRWGRDMDARTLPQEVGIDAVAVHYDKGCYLGQEAMAKIHFRGKVNRRLGRLEAAGPLRPGAEVVLGEQKVGRITSASDGRALAVLRHTVASGATVVAGGVEAKVVD